MPKPPSLQSWVDAFGAKADIGHLSLVLCILILLAILYIGWRREKSMAELIKEQQEQFVALSNEAVRQGTIITDGMSKISDAVEKITEVLRRIDTNQIVLLDRSKK